MQSGVIVTPSMSSLTGIVQNRAWRSTGSGAVRRLAYEAADCGLLSADLAAGIRACIATRVWVEAA
jgi:hypothetical protein